VFRGEEEEEKEEEEEWLRLTRIIENSKNN
jgi:hypothetical protein